MGVPMSYVWKHQTCEVYPLSVQLEWDRFQTGVLDMCSDSSLNLRDYFMLLLYGALHANSYLFLKKCCFCLIYNTIHVFAFLL